MTTGWASRFRRQEFIRGLSVAVARPRRPTLSSTAGLGEIEADAIAAAIVEADADEMTDAESSLPCLFDDAARYF